MEFVSGGKNYNVKIEKHYSTFMKKRGFTI
jgi:hypothetical protein